MREEADRLNEDIQNLLDATRISNEGIRPHAEWVDPAISSTPRSNTSAAARRASAQRRGRRGSAADPVDPTLIEKALGQLIENAVKYSPPGSSIEIKAEQATRMRAHRRARPGGRVSPTSGTDLGALLSQPAASRHTSQGSGLGLWIARALMTACGGHVEAYSAGVGAGRDVLPATCRCAAPESGSNRGRR